MQPDLKRQLERSSSLPTLPSVAIQILDLCQEDQLDLARIARVVSNDPAIVTRLIRTANSPLFALSKEIVSIQQAIGMLGINAVRTLVLSFSLAGAARRNPKQAGLDQYWRRSVLSAIAARELAGPAQINGDEAFICALLQDIGILAFSGTLGPSYARLQKSAGWDHDLLVELEKKNYGADHVEVGAWLLERWETPKAIAQVVGASHEPEKLDHQPPLAELARVVAVSGRFADLWSAGAREQDGQTEAARVTGRLAADLARFLPDVDFDTEVFSARLVDVVHEVAPIFEVSLQASERTRVLDRAKDALIEVSVRTSRELTNIQESIARLETRTARLLAESQRDPLTGIANRGFTNTYLEDTFKDAARNNRLMGVIFADIDHFKKINDTYGHLAGDAVLQSVAQSIAGSIRATDFAGRFGGEEFLVILRCEKSTDITTVAERIRSQIEAGMHSLGNNQQTRLTISIGCALVDRHYHETCWDLIDDADRSLYAAKRAGRNQIHLAESPQRQIVELSHGRR